MMATLMTSYSAPLVEGTLPAWRGSIATALFSARATPLKHDFGDVVAVHPVQGLDMQGQPAVAGEGLEELAHELGVELADLLGRKLGAKDEEGAAGHVERDAGQRLVHRQQAIGVAREAASCRRAPGRAPVRARCRRPPPYGDRRYGGRPRRGPSCRSANGGRAGRAYGRRSRPRSRSRTTPVPSRSSSTSMLVSFVLRATAPLRMDLSPQTGGPR